MNSTGTIRRRLASQLNAWLTLRSKLALPLNVAVGMIKRLASAEKNSSVVTRIEASPVNISGTTCKDLASELNSTVTLANLRLESPVNNPGSTEFKASIGCV